MITAACSVNDHRIVAIVDTCRRADVAAGLVTVTMIELIKMRSDVHAVPVACPSGRTITVAYGHSRGELREGAGQRYRR
jgi:hypothetical protein